MNAFRAYILVLTPILTVGPFGLVRAENAVKEMKSYENYSGIKTETGFVLRPRVEYNSQTFRDPFQGVQGEGGTPGATTKPPDLHLQGVVWGGSAPQAIINNNVYKVGDTIEEARIVDIIKEGVIIFHGGRQYTVQSPAIADGMAAKPQPEASEGGKNEKK